MNISFLFADAALGLLTLAAELGLFLVYPQLIVGDLKNRGCQMCFHASPYMVEVRGIAPLSRAGT
jgi:hypothetical protein